MATGMTEASFPMSLREAVAFLSRRYKLAAAQAQTVAYALLEAGALQEVAYALRFMDTQVQAAVPLSEIDLMVRQLLGAAGPGPAAVPPVAAESGGWELAATLPLGVPPPAAGAEAMRDAFVRVISAAHSLLRVSSPYMEQSGLNLVLAAFETAAKNGAGLRLLLRMDSQEAAQMRLVLAVLTLYELFGERLEVRSFAKSVGRGQYRLTFGVHAKLLVADDALAYVGSGELRDHSLNHNFEVGFVARGTDVVSRIAGLFDAVWEASSPVAMAHFQSLMR